MNENEERAKTILAQKAVPEHIWISADDEHGLDGRMEVDVRAM